MPRRKISEMEEHVGTPAADDWFTMVDKSDVSVASTGKNKKIRYDAMAPPSPTHPTLIVEWIGAPVVVNGGGGGFSVPFDGFVVGSVPAGWTLFPFAVSVPDGIYSAFWYWEQDGNGTFFDLYITLWGTPGSYGATYPTAPMAHPESYWGSGGIPSVPLTAGDGNNSIEMVGNNRDASDRTMNYSYIVISRLDA